MLMTLELVTLTLRYACGAPAACSGHYGMWKSGMGRGKVVRIWNRGKKMCNRGMGMWNRGMGVWNSNILMWNRPALINHKFRRHRRAARSQRAHSTRYWGDCAGTNPKTTHH